MRKNIKNDKVLRAITIALATMITVSASPVNVLAEENAEPDNDTNTSESSSEESSSSSEESQSEETSTVSEAAEVCETAEAIIDGTEAESTLPVAIENAAEAVAAVETSFVAPAETIEEITAALTEAGETVAATQETVAAAQTNIAAAQEAQDIADTMANAAAASVDTINNEIANINEAANSENTDLASLEAGLETANNAYETASAAATQAEAELQAAEIAHDKAVAELDKANEAIKNAQGNATAAQERMKAAQAKVDAIESKVNTLAKNKEALENLQAQYYNFLVHYYRNDAKTAVYHEDGSLDLEKSAAKAVAEGKAVDPGFCTNTLLLGRDLLKELVSLKIKMNGADADSIVFAAEGKNAKEAAAGTLTSDKGKARVTIDESTKYTQYWDNQSGESGRNNRAKVTYTKNGEEVTEYYNYVAKASQYGDEMDLENGTIFLAEVKKGDDNKWHAAADNSEFNFDDYSKILEAINIAAAASEEMNEYNKAKAAVDAATAEVDRLKDELDKINKVSVDGSVIAQLKADLAKAQEDLADAKDAKDALEAKVTKARAIVASVNLSKFENGAEAVEIAGDVIAVAATETEAAASAAAKEASSEAAEEAAGVSNAASQEAAGVLGARVDAPAEEAEEAVYEEVKINIEAEEETEEEENTQARVLGVKKLVRIEENQVPLADMPFESDDNISWWWLLVIALFGAAGKAMYENHKRKEAKK